MGIPKRIVLLIFLYFIQGLPYGFQARFMPIFLRSKGVSLTNVGFFKLLLAPWLCKAFWAPLVDCYGTKHKWLQGSILGLVATCAYACFISPQQVVPLCLVLFSLNFFASTQDIAVDGIALTILSANELGQGNTAQVVGYKIGSIFGGGILIWLFEYLGWMGLFLILTALYIEAWMFVYISPSLRDLGKINKHFRCHANCRAEPVSDLECKTSSGREKLAANDADIERKNNIEEKTMQSGNTGDSTIELSAQEEVIRQEEAKDDDKREASSAEVFTQKSDDSKIPPVSSMKSSKSVEKSRNGGSQKKVSFAPEDVAGVVRNRRTCDPSHNIAGSGDCSDHCQYSKEESIMKSGRGKLSMMLDVLRVPGTKWMIIYLLIYKLGEQGGLGMLPLYMVDKHVSSGNIAFWTGIVGQGISIVGSLMGGWLLSSFSDLPPCLILQQLNLIRMMPMGVMLWVVTFWSFEVAPDYIFYYGAILSMNLMLLVSGVITTVTFTFMMQCSQMAPEKIQATHYTLLATLEVFGKLAFMTVAGYFVDVFGYSIMYLVFTILTGAVIPWFLYCPPSLTKLEEVSEEGEEEECSDEEVSRKEGNVSSRVTEMEKSQKNCSQDKEVHNIKVKQS